MESETYPNSALLGETEGKKPKERQRKGVIAS